MNLQTWNKLPPDIQKIFDEMSPWAQKLHYDLGNEAGARAESVSVKAGNVLNKLTPEEKARWAKTTKPLGDTWATNMDAKGLPGKALLDEMYKIAGGHKDTVIEFTVPPFF